MRDPMTWSFPVGRMFGIRINVHVLLPLVLVGLILRVTVGDKAIVTLAEALVGCGLLFLSVLLHELGHCFAARSVDGDAVEVLLRPLRRRRPRHLCSGKSWPGNCSGGTVSSCSSTCS